MNPAARPASHRQRRASAGSTSRRAKAASASRSAGVPAAGPWAISVASPSSSKSDRAWCCCRGRGERSPGHLSGVAGACQSTREQRRGQRVEVRLARQQDVQRFESASRREQQRRRVAPAVGGERDPRPKDLCLGPLEVVERADLGRLDQGDRRRRPRPPDASLVRLPAPFRRVSRARRSTRPNAQGRPRPRRTRRVPGLAPRNVPGRRRRPRRA